LGLSLSFAFTIRVSGEIETDKARASRTSEAKVNWIFFIWIGPPEKLWKIILGGDTLIEGARKTNWAQALSRSWFVGRDLEGF